MRDKTLVNIRHSLCQKQNPVERPAETIDAISSLRPIFWQKAAKLFDNPQQDRAILCVKSGEFMVFPTKSITRGSAASCERALGEQHLAKRGKNCGCRVCLHYSPSSSRVRSMMGILSGAGRIPCSKSKARVALSLTWEDGSAPDISCKGG